MKNQKPEWAEIKRDVYCPKCDNLTAVVDRNNDPQNTVWDHFIECDCGFSGHV